MRFRALFFLVCVVLVGLGTSRSAPAQTVIVLGPNIQRREDRPEGVDARTINKDDCEAGTAGDSLLIALAITGPSPALLEIWAGVTNCDSEIVRQTPANIPDLCWQVGSITNATSSVVELAVRDILPHGDTGAGSGIADACATADSGSSASGTVTLFFVPTNGTLSVGPSAKLVIRYDVRGPSAPTLNGFAPGSTKLALSWSPGSDLDLKHYQLYCEPADSTDPSSCTSATLVAGQLAPRGSARKQVNATATTGVVDDLDNDQRYACAVAGIDHVGNAGPLSGLACVVPKVNAGPELTGRCQLGRAPITPGTSAFALTALSCLAFRRARARGRRGAPDPN